MTILASRDEADEAVKSPAERPSFAARLVRGRPADPRWVRPSIAALLIATAVLYLWNLGASEWANAFYQYAADRMARQTGDEQQEQDKRQVVIAPQAVLASAVQVPTFRESFSAIRSPPICERRIGTIFPGYGAPKASRFF